MRSILNINSGWIFTKEKSVVGSIPANGDKIDLPHTWNGEDGQDGGNDYYRGTCFYYKELSKPDLPSEGFVFLEINGANSEAVVYLNGEKLCAHDGGYAAWRVDLTDKLKEENLLCITVSNSPSQEVYPQVADFTFYGGLYRDVNIITVPQAHFNLEYYGGSGLKITPEVKGDNAEITAEAFIKNKTASQTLNFKIFDGEELVCEQTADENKLSAVIKIKNAHLWNGRIDPHLYSMQAILADADGTVIDTVSSEFGCRSFKIDAQKGFILNGTDYPLRGVSRHQDRPIIGNALLPRHHEEDIDLICEMGATTVRLAHYQHDQYFYDLCDKKGLIVWAEIPYISKHMPKAVQNTVSMMKELVIQNYNHPSIVVWGLSNEITMSGNSDSLYENHVTLNNLVHSLDKTRSTAIAVLTACSDDEKYVHIPDVVSYNLYYGWYGGTTDMNKERLDKIHKKHPSMPLGLSEYGCEALNWHSGNPMQGDYTEEYQAHYHEELIKQIAERPYLWATHVWNMFDFAADSRAEGGENGMNHKGLITFDRKYKKDSFYAYKAWLSQEPTLHICGKRYIDRTEEITTVTIYSNQPQVEVFVNGESFEIKSKGEFPFFYFNIPLSGDTKIVAKAGNLSDETTIKRVSELNEAYIMKDANSVINWFEINTPTGYFSINDNIGDIISTFGGKLFVLKALPTIKAVMSGGKSESGNMASGMKINKEIIEMAKGFTVKRLLGMVGTGVTKEHYLKLNKLLNKIKKPK